MQQGAKQHRVDGTVETTPWARQTRGRRHMDGGVHTPVRNSELLAVALGKSQRVACSKSLQ